MRYLPCLTPTALPDGLPPYLPGNAPRRPEDAIDTLARAVWGEGRGRSVRTLEALAAVAVNRAALRRAPARPDALDIAAAALDPVAFPAWRAESDGREPMLAVTADDPLFAVALRIARLALSGALADPTQGATRFHPADGTAGWAAGRIPAVEIGGLLFYNDED